MVTRVRSVLAWGAALVLLTSCLEAAETPGRVTVIATPDVGIQPQAISDASGAIHLLYYKGSPDAGDLFYVQTGRAGDGFSAPVRVNSQPGSAVAKGTIRGGQIALGRSGRVHVAWNGSTVAQPPNPIEGAPMLYTRSDASRTAFEPQRNLMRQSSGLDGGGTVAAGADGAVYVGWQGRSEGASEGEKGRQMWFARSTDDGATFGPESPISTRQAGACPCCGTRALVDNHGALYALYRAAGDGIERDMVLLSSRDRGEHFRSVALQPWRITTCPMSTASLAESVRGVVAAWETKGQVVFARIDPMTGSVSPPVSPPGGGNRKLPAVAANDKGEVILVWAEDTAWQRGGSLAWRIFSLDGRPTREGGRIEGGVPVWSLPTVVARPDGGFTIVH